MEANIIGKNKYRILCVEDDPGFGYILREYLELSELKVDLVEDGEKALDKLEKNEYEICLLDFMLPRIDGFQLAKKIRGRFPDLPFIFITAKSLKVDKLKGFRLGCDDYIVKPIDEELLLARIHAIIHRSYRFSGKNDRPEQFAIGRFYFDFAKQELQMGIETQHLTDKESQLLRLLCEYKNELLPRKKALQEIWGRNDEFNRKSMDVFIFRLRKRFEAERDIRIRNVHGKGFILEEPRL